MRVLHPLFIQVKKFSVKNVFFKTNLARRAAETNIASCFYEDNFSGRQEWIDYNVEHRQKVQYGSVKKILAKTGYLPT